MLYPHVYQLLLSVSLLMSFAFPARHYTLPYSWCQAPQAAWDQAKAEGWIKEIECRAFRRFANEPTDRGLCSGKYMLK